MPDKPAIYITVTGRTNSGLTTITKMIQAAIKSYQIEVVTNWGIDGEPKVFSPEIEFKKLSGLATRTKIILSEHQASRGEDGEVVETKVQVVYDVLKGFGTKLILGGAPLESWFGEFPASKERARALATRLSAELDVDVEDRIPREHDWVQPR